MKEKTFALAITIGLGALLLYMVSPFITSLFGALILYVLLLPLYKKWCKRLGAGRAALLTITTGLLIVLVPVAIITLVLVKEISSAATLSRELISTLQQMQLPAWLQGQTYELITQTTSFLRSILLNAIGSVTHFALSVIVILVTLYYLLINSQKLPLSLNKYLPFSTKNVRRLREEFTRVTQSGVLTTGVIAIGQGVLLGIGFVFAGISGAAFWGFVAAILSFLPIVGPFILWLPAGIVLLMQQHYGGGIFLLIWGTFISLADNFVRPKLQQKFGKIHPLITIIGVFAGLPLFGIVGIIIGPLLFNYFFLLVGMVKQEHYA